MKPYQSMPVHNIIWVGGCNWNEAILCSSRVQITQVSPWSGNYTKFHFDSNFTQAYNQPPSYFKMIFPTTSSRQLIVFPLRGFTPRGSNIKKHIVHSLRYKHPCYNQEALKGVKFQEVEKIQWQSQTTWLTFIAPLRGWEYNFRPVILPLLCSSTSLSTLTHLHWHPRQQRSNQNKTPSAHPWAPLGCWDRNQRWTPVEMVIGRK